MAEHDTLLEFLEVLIHQILYTRGVYPSSMFERRRKWNVPVWQSRHPELNSYVRETLLACAGDLEKGRIARTHIRLIDRDGSVLETFSLSIPSGAPTFGTDQLAADDLEMDFATACQKIALLAPRAPNVMRGDRRGPAATARLSAVTDDQGLEADRRHVSWAFEVDIRDRPKGEAFDDLLGAERVYVPIPSRPMVRTSRTTVFAGRIAPKRGVAAAELMWTIHSHD
ncbi:DNA-binding protein [Hyaloraphidium curvatum]|nr:DNA-binding protein [Hyaloraphidium curvatum]